MSMSFSSEKKVSRLYPLKSIRNDLVPTLLNALLGAKVKQKTAYEMIW